MIINKLQSGGFTLVESLVAIAILLIAVVGPISLIGDALHKLYYARDQMIAINLAQEGIEVVRERRDSNMLAVATWSSGFGPGDCNQSCIVDAPTPAIIKCVGGCLTSDTSVYLDPADGFYHQKTPTPGGVTVTNFKRVINTDKITNDEYTVTSTVTWMTGGQAGTITVSENLFKWAI